MKAILLSIHPAPYRDPAFARLARRWKGELLVLSLSRTAHNHSYWGLDAPPYPNRWADELPGPRDLRLRVVQFLQREKPDVILVPGHSHPLCRAALAWVAATRTPFVYSADTAEVPPSRARRWLLRALLWNAGAVWVPGARAEAAMRALGVPAKKIFTGCYALEPSSVLAPPEEAARLRRELREGANIPAEAFLALFVGELTPARRAPLLVEAAARLEGPDAPWVALIGTGAEATQVDEAIARAGTARILHLPPVPFGTLRGWYAAADAYVHPGHEPYSLAVMQAAMQGLPILATGNVGSRDDFDAASPLPEGDRAALAEALRVLAADRASAREKGLAGRERALRRTPEWAAGQLECALARALR